MPSAPLRSPTHLPLPTDLYPNFNPQLSWLCLRTTYHQLMNEICESGGRVKHFKAADGIAAIGGEWKKHNP